MHTNTIISYTETHFISREAAETYAKNNGGYISKSYGNHNYIVTVYH